MRKIQRDLTQLPEILDELRKIAECVDERIRKQTQCTGWPE